MAFGVDGVARDSARGCEDIGTALVICTVGFLHVKAPRSLTNTF